jgi:4-hydroxysphinganine ceramide fatty acyl 2-hydroxylase
MPKNYISNRDETVRMFDNDLLESLSHIHWSTPLWVFVPIISYFLFRSIVVLHIDYPQLIFLFFAGILVWTFTEYFLHRFVFHYQPKSEYGKRIHFIIHGVHHDYPKDSGRLVMPPGLSLPLSTLFYLLFTSIMGSGIVAPFFAGFLLGYLFYDITHYAIHHFNIRGKFWLAIKNHHAKHHYQDSNLGYGVSQPTWDYVFGTNFPEKETSLDSK